MTLPEPARERWQPLRLGVVDLFYYEDEQFHFRDGRLLLRGNNGTGKSKVLALTLPFLLDGELSAHRVEPDGDPKKRMEWNLLLGGEHPHDERLGYAWVEFGRRAADGTAEYRTLGCGLKAVSGRGIARRWYFSTTQRVGGTGPGGLGLLDATRTALSRDRLVEAVEGHGMVYDQAGDYRRAVDEALFGLGEERYGSLMDLLVQLRQPQLSKRPSEAALSRALTEALPPVDQAVIADVAEAYRELEDDEDELRAMADAERASSAFLDHYRHYARVAARRAARPPRREHSRYERLTSERTAALAAREQAQVDLDRIEARSGELASSTARLRGQDQSLRRSPEMDSARELDRAREEAVRSARRSEQASVDAARARGDAARARQRSDQADRDAERAGLDLERTREQALRSAREAGLAEQHRDAVDRALPEHAGPARRDAEDLVRRRIRALDHTAALLRAVDEAQGHHLRARTRLEDAETELADLGRNRAEAEHDLDAAARDHVASVRDHLGSCAELRTDDLPGLLDQVTDWAPTLDGPDPARQGAQRHAQRVETALAAREAELGVERGDLHRQSGDLEEERAQLQAGRPAPPPVPHTRTAPRGRGRPGAPLWKLVDFAEDLTGTERALLEAALEASGLLDAWVGPDGSLAAAGGDDTLAVADGPVPGPHLGQLLQPAIDPDDPDARAVTPSQVGALLAAIGTDEREDVPTWVTVRGRFRTGALRGSWTKDGARHLGEGAREQARRDRLGQITRALDALAQRLASADDELEGLAGRRRTLRTELDALPDDTALRAAHARVANTVRAALALTRRRDERAGELDRARARLDGARDELVDTAAELGTPHTGPELSGQREALSSYRVALAELWPAARTRLDTSHARQNEREESERAAHLAADLGERAEDLRLEAEEAAERRDTLGRTVGTAVAELNRMLAQVAGELRECDDQARLLEAERTEALDRRGRAAGQVERLDTDIAEGVHARNEAVEALRAFAATGVLGIALPDLEVPDPAREWAPDPAVRLARAVDRALEETEDSDQTWDRLQKNLSVQFKNLQDALSQHGHGAASWPQAGVVLVRVTFQGRERSVPEIAAALGEEVDARRALLSAREREVLENHLLTEVAGTLQHLITTAELQVERMNAELEGRPTSTGMRLRLLWRLRRDAPEGVVGARGRLLRQTADAWSADDRGAVGDFLQRLIERERDADPSAPWFDRLSRALDYRSWHRFAVQRHQHGQWNSATGPASGGERVLSASIPLFSAASSYYATATNPHSPRLIMLDEAFAGVDDDSRAKCLGLLHAFDLDVVMTSEREWGCYPQVPGLAIAQLSRMDGVPAVLVTRWEWNGRERLLAPEPDGTGAADPWEALPGGRAEGEASQEGLWK
ncbi:TIGR02680 family protein [Nocardiopsis quinghaiensis]|uniref:TIGR02680 family protein n=1 Tax=Nocardiopsis quinghaiensis TaxID=464995 RepID=UPI0012395A9C|nr:TIGR02680 family protein [Nocardiopsis quinghaiensis]